MGIGLIELNTSGILSIGDYEEAYDSGYLQYESYINTGKLSIIKSDYFIGSDWYLENLKTLEMPNVELIQTSPLFGSQDISLDTVIAPNLLGISGQAFSHCPSLKELNLPQLKALTYPLGCDNLEKLYIPNCSYIGQSVFSSMSQLSELDIRACTTLKDVPSNLSHLSLYAFSVIDNINFQNVNNSNLTIDFINVSLVNITYNHENWSIKTLNLPKCTEIIMSMSDFKDHFEEIYAPMATSINKYTFFNCVALKKVVLNKLSYAYSSMFFGCSNIEHIEMNAISIAEWDAFHWTVRCKSLFFNNLKTINYSYWSALYDPMYHIALYHITNSISGTYLSGAIFNVFEDTIISVPNIDVMYLDNYNYYDESNFHYGHLKNLNINNCSIASVYTNYISASVLPSFIGCDIRIGLPRNLKANKLKYLYFPSIMRYTNYSGYVSDWGNITIEIPYDYRNEPLNNILPNLTDINYQDNIINVKGPRITYTIYPELKSYRPSDYSGIFYTEVYGINYNFPNLRNVPDNTYFYIQQNPVYYNFEAASTSISVLSPTKINLPNLLAGNIELQMMGLNLNFDDFILNSMFSGGIRINDYNNSDYTGQRHLTISEYVKRFSIYTSDRSLSMTLKLSYYDNYEKSYDIGLQLRSFVNSQGSVTSYYQIGPDVLLLPNLKYINEYNGSNSSSTWLVGHSFFADTLCKLILSTTSDDTPGYGGTPDDKFIIKSIYAPELETIYTECLSSHSIYYTHTFYNTEEVYAPKLSNIIGIDKDFNKAFYFWGFHISSLTIGLTNVDRTDYSFSWSYTMSMRYTSRGRSRVIYKSLFSLEYLSMSMCSNLITNAFLYLNIKELHIPRCENLDIKNSARYYKNTNLITLSLPSLKTLGNIDVFTRLQNLTMPECISISDNAMYGNSVLTYLSLSKVEYIGSMALPNSLKLLRLSGYFSDGHGVYIGQQPFTNSQGVLQVPASLYTYYRTNYYSSMFNVMYYGNIESGEAIPYAYYVDSEHHYMDYYSEGSDVLHPSGFVPSYSDFTFIGYTSTSNMVTSAGYTPLDSKVASPFDIRSQYDILYAIFYKSNSFDMYDYQSSYTISGDGYFNNNDVISPIAVFDQIGYSGYNKTGWTNASDNIEPILYSNSSYYILNVLESSLYAVYSKSISLFYNLNPGALRWYQSSGTSTWRSAEYISGLIENIYHHGLNNLLHPVVDLFNDFVSENIKTTYYNTTISCWIIDSSYYAPGISYSMYESTYARLGVLADEYVISNNSINYQISIPDTITPSESKNLLIRNLYDLELDNKIYYDVFTSSKYYSYFDTDPHLSYLVTISDAISEVDKYFYLAGPTTWYRNKKCIFDLMLYAEPASSRFDISYLIDTPITYIIANDSYIYSSTIIFDSSHYSNGIFEYNIGQISLSLLTPSIYAYVTDYLANIYVTEWPSNDVNRDNRCFLNIKNMRIVNQDDSPIIF